jgi:hypothetical protein
MPANNFAHLYPENRRLLELLYDRDESVRIDPTSYIKGFRPCSVRVLLVADGLLDFSTNDFGLRTFVETLLATTGFHVRFQITLGHIDNVADNRIMMGDTRIARSIKQFKFDDPAHFSTTLYDQVWLFGISTFYSRGTSPGGQPYPNDRLSNDELRVISDFMNGGGGLFATGDHGLLGRCLGSRIPRARSMRLWEDTSSDDDINEVSMGGPRRNDTNRLGDAESQFADQSDDVPQQIEPKMYYRFFDMWRSMYPHPLLCGPNGVIRVMPDHPHEGQCIEPQDPNQNFDFGGGAKPEYPPSTSGGIRPLPEIISTSTVLAGTISGKTATQAHSFGGISAYDGHRAGVGRVVTDATWHHFVNVNLVGDTTEPIGSPKRFGFLYSTQGQAHLEEIKAYYRNIAVWLSRPANIVCMNRRFLWWLVWNARVMEATLTTVDIRLRTTPAHIMWQIGKHARDVLGRYAGQCRVSSLADWLLQPVVSMKLRLALDPWAPHSEKEVAEMARQVPWSNPEPIVEIALGAAIVSVRESFGEKSKVAEIEDKSVDEAIFAGAKLAVELSAKSMAATVQRANSLVAVASPAATAATARTPKKRARKRR